MSGLVVVVVGNYLVFAYLDPQEKCLAPVQLLFCVPGPQKYVRQ